MCVSELGSIWPGNGLSPIRRQAFTWTKCWTIRNKLQWKSNQNPTRVIHESTWKCRLRNGGHLYTGEDEFSCEMYPPITKQLMGCRSPIYRERREILNKIQNKNLSWKRIYQNGICIISAVLFRPQCVLWVLLKNSQNKWSNKCSSYTGANFRANEIVMRWDRRQKQSEWQIATLLVDWISYLCLETSAKVFDESLT